MTRNLRTAARTKTARPTARAKVRKPPTAAINDDATATPGKIKASHLADQLKERIRHGHLVPGQRLIENELMRDTDASRARVREALRQLAVEGFVVIEEFRGAVVKQLTRDEVFQIGAAREVLEGLAARLIAETPLKPPLRNELRRIQRELDSAAKAMRYDRYATLNEQLHTFIFSNCGNPYVATFIDRLRLPIFRLQHSNLYSGERFLDGNTEHANIVNAILAGEAATAEKLMRAHVRAGTRVIQDLYYK